MINSDIWHVSWSLELPPGHQHRGYAHFPDLLFDERADGRSLRGECDDAWVAGPCFSQCVGFIPGTDRLYYVSEETGYAHLYAVNADGSDKRALTSGEWEVLGVTMPEDRSHFLMRTNEGSPFNEHAWRMDFDGSDREAITTGEGRFNYTQSPDGDRAAIVHDVANRPPELFVADADGSDMEQVTTSPTDEWMTFDWIARFS